jgi:hypothetical protein
MPTESQKEKLMAMAASISTAVAVLKSVEPTMLQLIEESIRMENIGPVLAPGLYLNEERRCVEAIMVPLTQSALALIRAYDAQLKTSAAALQAVKS